MFSSILVAVDPSHGARQEAALATARKLAVGTYAEITALTVVDLLPNYLEEDVAEEARLKAGKDAMTAIRELAGKGSEIRTVVRHGRPAHEIIQYSKENQVDCIIVASHKPGLGDYFLGSTASRVVRHAPCTVIVLR